PEQRHKLPVPGGDIHHDPPNFHWLVYQRNDTGVEQCQHSSSEVNGVRAGQQVNKRATRTGGQKEASGGEFAPGHPLSYEKTHAQDNRAAQPGKASSFSNRNPGNRFDWSQGYLASNFSSPQLHGDTAHDQQQSVHQQQRGG